LPLDELQLQARKAERSIRVLRAQNEQMQSMRKADAQRKSSESALLLSEVNNLRMQNKSLQDRIKNLSRKLQQVPQIAGTSLPPLAISDEAWQPSSDDQSSPGLPLRSSSAAQLSLPRMPSGSMPGSRQHRSLASVAGSQLMPRTKSLPSFRARPCKQQTCTPEQQKTQAVQANAEAHSNELRTQKIRTAQLRNQIDHLLKEQKATIA
jgi:hypothetical protein